MTAGTQTVETILREGAVAVIRMGESRRLSRVIEALLEGGMKVMEITLTMPDAFEQIQAMSRGFQDSIVIGAGSVLNEADARKSVQCGARFLVSPVMKPSLIRQGGRLGVPVFAAGFTPTEILAAHEAGAALVKVFPAHVLGLDFFRAVKGPLPHIPLMPTGGVTPANGGEWILAGAACVGVGGALLDKKAIADENYQLLTDRARLLLKGIGEARSRLLQ
ncbi:MAG TPA: bifunctional 4-hydroxy-2-oxoglutarate aldolase/2-dehydro-3-deoxy-phosphogluconate aldolase [bacterium]|nr:bifunctional 4-hydroxy-2-oxoglutarate aldolase/2-dehydro-3-deoxy-phosphogluconate aldolase [bacterium]